MPRTALKLAGLILLGSGMLLCAPAGAAQYQIVHKFRIGGEGGWDYIAVDEAAARLFVSHATRVEVLDERTGKLLGTIPDTPGVHGIALAADLNKGFISNGKDNSITVFDLQTLAVLARVATTGSNPDAIVYDPFSQQVFCFNGRSANATVLDARTVKVTGMVALDGKPEFAVVDGHGRLYVNIEDKNMVCRIDTKLRKVDQKWSVAPGEEPSGLALDVAGQRLFSVCHNKLMIILDAQQGKVVSSVPIGEQVDGTGFDPVTKRAYSSNGEGTLTVIHQDSPDQYTVLENVPTQQGARTLVVDTQTHHVFLPTAEYEPTPEPTAQNPRPRPPIKPGTFLILDVAPPK